MRQRGLGVLGLYLCACLLAGAALAGTASAAPVWKFEGAELEGKETIVGTAPKSTFTIPGLTTTCDISMATSISNSAGTGKALVFEIPMKNCGTSSPFCTVDAASAEALPWAGQAKTVSAQSYVVLEGVRFSVLYGGALCPLQGVVAKITGSAGGRYDNATATLTFDPASFKATATQLKALGSTVEWKAIFPVKAAGAHTGEKLTL